MTAPVRFSAYQGVLVYPEQKQQLIQRFQQKCEAQGTPSAVWEVANPGMLTGFQARFPNIFKGLKEALQKHRWVQLYHHPVGREILQEDIVDQVYKGIKIDRAPELVYLFNGKDAETFERMRPKLQKLVATVKPLWEKLLDKIESVASTPDEDLSQIQKIRLGLALFKFRNQIKNKVLDWAALEKKAKDPANQDMFTHLQRAIDIHEQELDVGNETYWETQDAGLLPFMDLAAKASKTHEVEALFAFMALYMEFGVLAMSVLKQKPEHIAGFLDHYPTLISAEHFQETALATDEALPTGQRDLLAPVGRPVSLRKTIGWMEEQTNPQRDNVSEEGEGN